MCVCVMHLLLFDECGESRVCRRELSQSLLMMRVDQCSSGIIIGVGSGSGSNGGGGGFEHWIRFQSLLREYNLTFLYSTSV